MFNISADTQKLGLNRPGSGGKLTPRERGGILNRTPVFRHRETEITTVFRDLHRTDKIYPQKYPFTPREEDGEEGSGGETSDKHCCGRTKSHLIQRGGKEEERRCGTRRDKVNGPRCEDEEPASAALQR